MNQKNELETWAGDEGGEEARNCRRVARHVKGGNYPIGHDETPFIIELKAYSFNADGEDPSQILYHFQTQFGTSQ